MRVATWHAVSGLLSACFSDAAARKRPGLQPAAYTLARRSSPC